MIRLLKKDEIAKSQAIDRQREISEGLKISRKVDSLRQLQAKEEEVLEKWRSDTLAGIQKDIAALEKKKEGLTLEIQTLEDKAQKELSKTDRKRLDDLKKSLEAMQESLQERKATIDLREIDVALALKEARDAFARQHTSELDVERLKRKAVEEQKEAALALSNARTTEENAEKLKEETEQALYLREHNISQREVIMASRETEIETREREIVAEKARLKDQRETLERALERIRINRL